MFLWRIHLASFTATRASVRSVTVAVVANLTPAPEEIASLFEEQNPGLGVRAKYGACGIPERCGCSVPGR